MAGQVARIRRSLHEVAIPFSEYTSERVGRSGELGLRSSCMTAHSVEFVAKPGEALKAKSALGQAIARTLREVTGFAGCLVMTSDQEARLMTVVTFWRGSEGMKHCNANTRWVSALLAPYMDRRLRTQTMMAQLAAAFLEGGGECGNEAAAGEGYAEQEDEVCVA